MKHLIITIMLLSTVNLFGQVRNFEDIPNDILEQFSKMGVDTSPLLNNYESTYFNVIFRDSLMGFDFTGKKIGFVYSAAKSNKQEYFNLEKNRFNRNTTINNGTLYIFDAVQKEESGGYDAAIVFWNKRNYLSNDLVRKLKEKH